MKRLISIVIVLLVNQFYVCDCGQRRYNVKAKHNKALYGFSFLNITMASMEKCMAKCLENCLCMSFQLCEDKRCELCSTDKIQSPTAFRERKGCTNYIFRQMLYKQHCHNNCFAGISCCLTSNPCQNGGTCISSSSTDTTTRFKCSCPDGYTGNLCQYHIKSCRGYINGSRVSKKYKVFDNNMKPFEVFCDFDLDSNMAWTIIQSYQLQNKSQFDKSFLLDIPVNEESFSWESYRLSKSRMESIQNDSTKWRITCQYETDGVFYTDYVDAAINKMNILTYNEDSCQEVEFIDIRGHNCSTCTVHIIQSIDGDKYPLHVDSYFSKDCQFNAKNGALPCADGGEDNFGFYFCTNKAHRCSAKKTSTTQTWFGGN